jgi:hypothetical protein
METQCKTLAYLKINSQKMLAIINQNYTDQVFVEVLHCVTCIWDHRTLSQCFPNKFIVKGNVSMNNEFERKVCSQINIP